MLSANAGLLAGGSPAELDPRNNEEFDISRNMLVSRESTPRLRYVNKFLLGSFLQDRILALK